MKPLRTELVVDLGIEVKDIMIQCIGLDALLRFTDKARFFINNISLTVLVIAGHLEHEATQSVIN